MTIGLTGIDAVEAEMRDRLAAKDAEIERLRREIAALKTVRANADQVADALPQFKEGQK